MVDISISNSARMCDGTLRITSLVVIQLDSRRDCVFMPIICEAALLKFKVNNAFKLEETYVYGLSKLDIIQRRPSEHTEKRATGGRSMSIGV